MATPPPDQQNTLTGYCDVWNGYFIGTMSACIVLVGFNTYISHRRDKYVTIGKLDWGVPWGIGVFLFNIGIWNLLPPNIFFLLFKVILPNYSELAPEMACIAVEAFPFITTFLVSLAFQIVFLYNPNSSAEATKPWMCDDSELAPLANEREGDDTNGDGGHHPVVLLFGAPSRGRVLCERLLSRVAYEEDPSNNKYISPNTQVVLFNTYSEKERDFVKNNLEVNGVDRPETDRLYEMVTPISVSHDNCFKLPYADDSVDKVLWSLFIRNAAPIGTFTTPENIKAQKMAMLLDEVFRVLKPGGKFVSVDSNDRACLTYADLRDSIGEEHVTLKDNACVVKLSPFYRMQMSEVVGTKPTTFVSTGRLHVSNNTKQQGDDSQRMVGGGGGECADDAKSEETQDYLLNESFIDAKTGEEVFRGTMPHWKTMLVMLSVQITIFFGLCFATASLYMPLNFPADVPLAQRAGNVLPTLASSFASFAFFEREVVLGTMHFKSVGALLFWELKGSTITVALTLLLTVILAVPVAALQILLAKSGLSTTVLVCIGLAISTVVGLLLYKYSTYARTKSTLASRNLDYATYKKFF